MATTSIEAHTRSLETSTHTGEYEYTVDDLCCLIKPTSNHEAYFRVTQAFERLVATGIPPAEIALKLQQETMQVGLNHGQIVRLIGDKADYFSQIADNESRLFLTVGANAHLSYLESLRAAYQHDVKPVEGVELMNLNLLIEETTAFRGLIFQPQTIYTNGDAQPSIE